MEKRVIKFRAWDYQDKVWLEPSSYLRVAIDGSVHVTGMPKSRCEIFQLWFMRYNQDTGESLEVFDGDIVRTRWQERAQIMWDDHNVAFCAKSIGDSPHDTYYPQDIIEVIGNICEFIESQRQTT